jgi:hypothetical protein
MALHIAALNYRQLYCIGKCICKREGMEGAEKNRGRYDESSRMTE